MPQLTLGTRGSALALWQARHVTARLQEAHPGLAIEIRIIRTEGDRRTDVSFGDIGGKGVFVKEIEDALLNGEIDVAVHSLKDMPTEQPPGLCLTAVPERHDPRDALLTVEGVEFDRLPLGITVATGSPRRRSQLLHARPDLRMSLVRIRKLKEGQFGAMVLAVAGIERLGITAVPYRPIPTAICTPAVGQGALAIEARTDDAATRALLAVLEHAPSAQAVRAERAFLRRLGGGCLAPATAHARIEDGRIALDAMVGDPDGRRLLRDREAGAAGQGERLGEELAVRLLEAGGEGILREARAAAASAGPEVP